MTPDSPSDAGDPPREHGEHMARMEEELAVAGYSARTRLTYATHARRFLVSAEATEDISDGPPGEGALRRETKLPEVLTRREVVSLLEQAASGRDRALLMRMGPSGFGDRREHPCTTGLTLIRLLHNPLESDILPQPCGDRPAICPDSRPGSGCLPGQLTVD